MPLQIASDPRLMRREWRATRLGWALMCAIVVAGLLGLLGSGPVSATSATGDKGLMGVEYRRVLHLETTESMTLVLSPTLVEDGRVTVEMSGPWLDTARVIGAIPEPATQWVVPDGLRWQWTVEELGASTIRIDVRAEQPGLMRGQLSAGPDSLAFTQLVLP
jgi:hypothetical protein